MIDTLRSDVRHTLRSLAQHRTFAATAILTIAIGIGAATAIFTVVYATLWRPLPFRDPSRLMLLHLESPDRQRPGAMRPMVWSYPKYELLRGMQRVFSGTSTFRQQTFTVSGGASPERVYGEVIGPAYLDILGVAPLQGADLRAAETDRAPVALLGHAIWLRQFAGDPNAIGAGIQVNGVLHTVLGVLPPGFRGLTAVGEIWVPIWTMTSRDLGAPFAHNHGVIARVAEGVPLEAADAAMRAMGPEIDKVFPAPGEVVRRGAYAEPLDDARLDAGLRSAVLLLSLAVGCLLLLASANLASLLLARAAERTREIAVRLALGARAARLVRQLLTESMVLGLLGAAAGVLIAAWGTRLLAGLAAATPPDALGARAADLTTITLATIRIDGAALMFSVMLALLTSSLFGLAPAWRSARVDVTSAMKRGTTGTGQIGGIFNARGILVAAQIALAFALLAGAGLLLRSFDQLRRTPLGFDPDRVLTARIAVPASQPGDVRTQRFFDALLGGASSLPGVTAGTLSSCTPLSTLCEGTRVYLPEQPVPIASAPSVGMQYVSPAYFETLRIPLIAGRTFDDRDNAGAPQVIIVNEEAARLFWPGGDAVGRRLHVGAPSEVVGVVANIRRDSIEAPPRPEVYRAFAQSGRSSGFVLLRSASDPLALAAPLGSVVRALDPGVPLFDVQSMADRVGRATVRSRWSTTTMGVFAVMALLVAAIGIYGLLALIVEGRSREIGIRVALGAGPRDVVADVLRPAAVLVMTGTAVGLLLALSASRLLERVLYGVRPHDALTLTVLPLVIAAAAAVACYRPARRAIRIDPSIALRES